MMKCKIRITKDIEGLFPHCTPKIGKVYDAEYIESTCKQVKAPPICIVGIAGKRIIIRKDEFEILRFVKDA